MTFRIRIDRVAQQEIDEFAIHAAVDLAEAPLRRSFFVLTGAPYRAHLFRVGRRTHYWIIYTVDEDARTVDALRFWNASRDPQQFVGAE